MKVSVSILSEKENLKESIEILNNIDADYIHLDIMDSTFTPSSSFDISSFYDIEFNKKIDVHLMSNNLDNLIDEYSKLNPNNITFHVEVGDTIKYINKIKDKGIKVGLAINPNSDLELIYPYLEMVDIILVMSVNPGFAGQKFITDTVAKMQELREIKENYNFEIEVDGGINSETIKYVSNYVDISVSGSYIFNDSDINKQINSLK